MCPTMVSLRKSRSRATVAAWPRASRPQCLRKLLHIVAAASSCDSLDLSFGTPRIKLIGQQAGKQRVAEDCKGSCLHTIIVHHREHRRTRLVKFLKQCRCWQHDRHRLNVSLRNCLPRSPGVKAEQIRLGLRSKEMEVKITGRNGWFSANNGHVLIYAGR